MNRILIAVNDESGGLGSGGDSVFGSIRVPKGYDQFGAGVGQIGLLIFMSRIIQLIFVVAGIFVMYNVISAGFIYLSSEGDSKAHEKVKNQITYSVVGLLLIVLSFGFASLIGLLFFGDATFILNPTITSPTP